MKSEVVENIRSAEWAKLIQFCAAAGIPALTRLKWYSLLRNPALSLIAARMVKEGAEIAFASGIELDDCPSLPLKRLSSLPIDSRCEFRLVACGVG